MEEIIKSISKDMTTKVAVKKYLGLRLVRQDPFQCFISFIVSSNSNIQKIKSSLEKISMKFGKKIQFDNKEFYLFPEPKKIANATIQEIQNCGVGYRAKFIIDAAKRVESKQIDFDYLKKSNYQDAKEIILTVPGIGNKVADCILLFSLDKMEAFPLDRWMIRILEKYYLDKFELETKSITDKQYDILHEKIVKYFGPYAGYAQQFLFKMERENYQKKWL
jgi:N-glycosylase/DNA lyase